MSWRAIERLTSVSDGTRMSSKGRTQLLNNLLDSLTRVCVTVYQKLLDIH